MDAIYISEEIEINATIDKVWEMLVNPEKTKEYMFGCKIVCNWTEGSDLLWQGASDGVNYVIGKLLNFQKDKILTFTVFDPNGNIPNIPENHLTATYTLVEENGKTKLKIEQGNFATVADGGKRYEDTTANGGWMAVLKKIKALAEQH